MTDDMDIERQIKCIYTRGSNLLERFRQCDDSIHVKLFQSYSSSFTVLIYGVHLLQLPIESDVYI